MKCKFLSVGRIHIRQFLQILITSVGIICIFGFINQSSTNIPIYIREFGVEIREIEKLGDTLFYNKSGKEDFKFVFHDTKGQCSFERFINGKLYQKGHYVNSLDTLKRYVSSRNTHGKSSAILVQKYFEPLKNGEWIETVKGRIKRKNYEMGEGVLIQAKSLSSSDN
jgi:hypothetical protein